MTASFRTYTTPRDKITAPKLHHGRIHVGRGCNAAAVLFRATPIRSVNLGASVVERAIAQFEFDGNGPLQQTQIRPLKDDLGPGPMPFGDGEPNCRGDRRGRQRAPSLFAPARLDPISGSQHLGAVLEFPNLVGELARDVQSEQVQHVHGAMPPVVFQAHVDDVAADRGLKARTIGQQIADCLNRRLGLVGEVDRRVFPVE